MMNVLTRAAVGRGIADVAGVPTLAELPALVAAAPWDPVCDQAKPDIAKRRRKTGVPAGVGHREKWRLALDMLDEMAGWGLRPPLVVADAGYGDCGEFRLGLTERGLSYVVHRPGQTPPLRVRTRPPRTHLTHTYDRRAKKCLVNRTGVGKRVGVGEQSTPGG